MNERIEKIKILDSVRAIATASVFLFHAGYLLTYSQNKLFSPVRFVTFGGTVGVCIFFVLSGWLLFYQLYRHDRALTKSDLWDYTKKRLFRILPLYYFSLFFIVLLLRPEILSAPDGIRSILYNLVFLRGIKGAGGGGTITINPVYWTLVIEMHFYFLLPIFYYLFYPFRNIKPFLAVIFLGLAYRAALITFLPVPSMQLLRFTPANFDFFAIGMLGAYLYVRKVKWLELLGKEYMQVLSILGLLVFVRFYDLEFLPTWSYVFAPIFLGLIIILIIISFIFNNRSCLSRLFTIKPILFIGKISYSIYVWHAIVIPRVDMLDISGNYKFLLNIVITLIVSTITYYAVEAPFLRLKSRENPILSPAP